MRIIEVIIEATDPIGVNTVIGNHIEGPNTGEGDNKTITGANTMATVDNLTPPMEAKKNYYGNYQGRGGRGHGRNHFRPCGHRRGNNNYQYH